MKQNKISNLPTLKPERFENIFNVHQEADGKYYYNLLQTVVLPKKLPSVFFETYSVKHKDTWPLISYKHYKTPNMWWIILIANHINDPTKFPQIGTTIKIPTTGLVQTILSKTNVS
jgi:hypothetical protein